MHRFAALLTLALFPGASHATDGTTDLVPGFDADVVMVCEKPDGSRTYGCAARCLMDAKNPLSGTAIRAEFHHRPAFGDRTFVAIDMQGLGYSAQVHQLYLSGGDTCHFFADPKASPRWKVLSLPPRS